MSSAQALVFSTPELLELILSHLPLPSLLTIRRTSSYLNNLIQTSPLLRQKLFFRAHSVLPIESWHANSLLRQYFPPFFPAPEEHSKSRSYGRSISAIKGLDWAQDPQKRSAFLRKEASWRHMSLTSHPSSTLRIVEYVHARGGDGLSIARIPSDGSSAGVTMGIVYDIVHSFLAGHSASSFRVVFQRDCETGEVGITLALYRTIQCTIMYWAGPSISFRSEGEVMKVSGLEWQRGRDEEHGDVPGMRDVWETELTVERGGVEE